LNSHALHLRIRSHWDSLEQQHAVVVVAPAVVGREQAFVTALLSAGESAMRVEETSKSIANW
jgi:hypothetical protein